MNQSKVIGLTGGSGSGKSTVAAIFAELGASVIDADKISHEITSFDAEVIKKIKDEFSEKVFENGVLSRKALGKIVFNDKDALVRLNKIVHPAIAKKISEIAEKYKNTLVVIDAPLLFDVQEILTLCDSTIAVLAPEDVRINRIACRDGITRCEAAARINSQKPQQEIADMADFVIINDGNIEKLRGVIVDYINK